MHTVCVYTCKTFSMRACGAQYRMYTFGAFEYMRATTILGQSVYSIDLQIDIPT